VYIDFFRESPGVFEQYRQWNPILIIENDSYFAIRKSEIKSLARQRSEKE